MTENSKTQTFIWRDASQETRGLLVDWQARRLEWLRPEECGCGMDEEPYIAQSFEQYCEQGAPPLVGDLPEEVIETLNQS